MALSKATDLSVLLEVERFSDPYSLKHYYSKFMNNLEQIVLFSPQNVNSDSIFFNLVSKDNLVISFLFNNSWP